MENKLVLEVAKTLESVLVEDGPYSLTTIESTGEHESEVSREELLEHYMHWAMETIYNEVDETEQKNDTSLKELAHELDSKLGDLLSDVTTINDIDTSLGHLREDLDNWNPDDARFFIREVHHQVRVISVLTKYVTEELNVNYEGIVKLKNNLFDKVVRNDG